MDAQNGGLEAQNGTKDQWSQIPIILMRSRIRIRIEEKSGIRIRIKMIRIRNPEVNVKYTPQEEIGQPY